MSEIATSIGEEGAARRAELPDAIHLGDGVVSEVLDDGTRRWWLPVRRREITPYVVFAVALLLEGFSLVAILNWPAIRKALAVPKPPGGFDWVDAFFALTCGLFSWQTYNLAKMLVRLLKAPTECEIRLTPKTLEVRDRSSIWTAPRRQQLSRIRQLTVGPLTAKQLQRFNAGSMPPGDSLIAKTSRGDFAVAIGYPTEVLSTLASSLAASIADLQEDPSEADALYEPNARRGAGPSGVKPDDCNYRRYDSPDGATVFEVAPTGWDHGMFALGIIFVVSMTLVALVLIFGNGVRAPILGAAAVSFFWLTGFGLILAGINVGTRRTRIGVGDGYLFVETLSRWRQSWREVRLRDVLSISASPSGMEIHDQPILNLRITYRRGAEPSGRTSSFSLLSELPNCELEWLAGELRELIGVSEVDDAYPERVFLEPTGLKVDDDVDRLRIEVARHRPTAQEAAASLSLGLVAISIAVGVFLFVPWKGNPQNALQEVVVPLWCLIFGAAGAFALLQALLPCLHHFEVTLDGRTLTVRRQGLLPHRWEISAGRIESISIADGSVSLGMTASKEVRIVLRPHSGRRNFEEVRILAGYDIGVVAGVAAALRQRLSS